MGIVHRDLKPDNVMIARNRDGSDCVKVVDFGIAKAADSAAQKVTKTGLVVGTPEYMSPEQLAGDKLDGRSDIYSLALVTFNMLTGRLPFPAETVQEAMIMRLTDRPRTLSETRPEVAWPAELQQVLDRALARDAAERYQSASEFGRDIVRAVAAMPMTLTADMGTEVLAAVPPTRVGAPAAAVAPASPSSAPGTRAAPAAAAAAPAPARRARRPLALAAVALGAVVAVGGGLFAVTRDAAVTAPDSTAQNVTTGTAQPSDTVTSSIPAVPMSGSDSSRLLASAGTPTSRKVAEPAVTELRRETPAASPTGLSNAEIAARLKEFDDWTNLASADSSDARRVVTRSAELLPQLRTRAQRAEAMFYRGQAYLILEENENACRVFREARSDASGTPFERAIDANFSHELAPCR
jgi:serine/threonine-protein kinase